MPSTVGPESFSTSCLKISGSFGCTGSRCSCGAGWAERCGSGALTFPGCASSFPACWASLPLLSRGWEGATFGTISLPRRLPERRGCSVSSICPSTLGPVISACRAASPAVFTISGASSLSALLGCCVGCASPFLGSCWLGGVAVCFSVLSLCGCALGSSTFASTTTRVSTGGTCALGATGCSAVAGALSLATGLLGRSFWAGVLGSAGC